MAEFRGLFPAIVTPMTADGNLNESAFREVMEFNIQAGVHGFWIAGGTGESILLTDEENGRIAEIAADQSRGRITNIMHVGAASTARAAAMAENAAKAGVEAICCLPPFLYRYGGDQVVEHYRAVAAAADLPFLVYNLPQFTQVEITPDFMKVIQDRVPQLVGLKHSAPLMSYVRDYTKMGLSCLIGNSSLLLPALTLGATGCVDGPPNAAPELWIEILNAYNEGDLARAEAAQDRASEFTLLVRNYETQAGTKAVLSERLGIDCGDPRPPIYALPPERKRELAERLAALGLERVTVAK